MRARTLAESFRYAWQGLVYAWSTQRNMRIHAAAAAGAIALGAWLDVGRMGMAALTMAAAVVLFAELLNTALEAAVDLATKELHPLARQAKNVAAGAVLVTAIAAAAVGWLVLGGPLRAELQKLFHG